MCKCSLKMNEWIFFPETSSRMMTNNTFMKILTDEKDSKLQKMYSHESKKSKKSKPKTRKKDEIREKSRTSKEDFRKRMNNNFEPHHNSQKCRKKDEKTRKGIAAQFFSNTDNEDKKISSSAVEQKLDAKINRKIKLNISTLVVTELLHEMIDSIFKNSKNTSTFVKNSKKTLDDDAQSIESGEIKSDSESCSSDVVVLETSTKEVAEEDGHTCEQDLFKICPKCIHFRFQGSKKIGPGYRESHKYSSEFNLELSTDIFDLLKRQKINLTLLLCVQDSSSFKILEKSITLKNRIREIESAQVQVSFYSRHQPE